MQDWYAGARLIIRRRRPDLDRMAPSPQAVAHPEKVTPRRSVLRSSSGWLSSAWVGEAPARRAVRCDRLADEAEWQAVATRPVSYYHMMAGENRKIAERAGAAWYGQTNPPALEGTSHVA
jgi:hypothetical protein